MKLEQELSQMSVESEVARVRKTLPWNTKRMRVLPEVEAWLKTFEQDLFRYKFLVLDGPSQMGKTIYARSLSPECSHFLENRLRGGQ